MMRKSYLVICAVTLLFIAGCTSATNKQEAKGRSFVGGTDGLDFLFAKGSPPDRVLDSGQEEFDIALLITNLGEFTVPRGRLIATLSGIAAQDFNIGSLTKVSDFALAGKGIDRELTIEGDTEEILFERAKYQPDLPADFFVTIRADICYDYQTRAVGSLCLKRNPRERSVSQDICDVDAEEVVIENSGAPLQIELLRQRPSSSNIIKVSFDVVNKNNGVPYNQGTFNAECSGNDAQKDKVRVRLDSPGNRLNIRCSRFDDRAEGVINLIAGRKQVTCDIDTTNLQNIAFQHPLIISVDYMYREAITTANSIVIEDAG
ncbi:hypothetical protein J4430_01030 [Candidatus Woesearchaeota archaeon]|nr:hypothetical protein [Candidatus Woesearchaeota archaeon]